MPAAIRSVSSLSPQPAAALPPAGAPHAALSLDEWAEQGPVAEGEQRQVAVARIDDNMRRKSYFLCLKGLSLTSLPDLSHLRHVTELDLAENKLTTLSGRQLPPELRTLEVQHNLFTELFFIPSAKSADFSNNLIQEIDPNVLVSFGYDAHVHLLDNPLSDGAYSMLFGFRNDVNYVGPGLDFTIADSQKNRIRCTTRQSVDQSIGPFP